MLFKKYIHIIKYATYLPAIPIRDVNIVFPPVETPIYHIKVICCTSRCGLHFTHGNVRYKWYACVHGIEFIDNSQCNAQRND